MFNKTLLLLSLLILNFTYNQNLYAHSENNKSGKQEDMKKVAEKQLAKENWDDFMKAFKGQHAKEKPEGRSKDNSTIE